MRALTLLIATMLATAGLAAPSPAAGADSSASGCSSKSCHGALTARAHPHPPAAEGECTSCHAPAGATHPGGGPAFKPTAEGAALCATCHELPKTRNVHPPVADGECLACHDPHGSAEPHLLKAPLNQACFECHEADAFKVHVVTGVSLGGSHPLSGVPDPSRKGEPLSCVSCHDPHGSDSPRLWRFKAESTFDLCSHCHSM